MSPTSVSAPDLTAITVFLASTATPERGGLPYLDAVLPAEHRLAATRVVRDLGALPPDAILYLIAQPLLDRATDHLMLNVRADRSRKSESIFYARSQTPVMRWVLSSILPSSVR